MTRSLRRRPKRARLLGEHFRPDGAPKRAFGSKGAAEKFADENGVRASIYRCSVCKKYHYSTIYG